MLKWASFTKSDIPGPQEWLEHVVLCRYLPEQEIKRLCDMVRRSKCSQAQVKELLTEESNIQPVLSPVTVCGDIHGQFYDLLELFKVGGQAPDTSYIFMVC